MSKSSYEIKIGDMSLTAVLSGNVNLRLDQLCSDFSFDVTKSLCNEFNIEEQSSIKIYLAKNIALNGFVDSINPSEDPLSSTVSIVGRSKLCDIVDSDLPVPITLSGGVSLSTVATKVLSACGVSAKVINRLAEDEVFSKTDIISAEADQNAFEFLNQYAEKVNALLYSDEDGNLIIGRAGSGKYSDKLINIIDGEDNNIKSSSAGFDYSERFYKYTVISQENTNASSTSVSTATTYCKGYAYDNEVRKSRSLTIKAENPSTNEQCAKIATFEANIRRANSLKYTCTVDGYSTNNGSLWLPSRSVHVIDDDNGVDSELLIKGCNFNLGNGTVTMDFGLVDAFTLQANLDELNSRTHVTKAKKKKKGKKKKSKKAKEDSTPVNIDFGSY